MCTQFELHLYDPKSTNMHLHACLLANHGACLPIWNCQSILASSCQEADAALEIYGAVVDQSARKSFVSQFEGNGSGKGPNALKFTNTFSKTLSMEDKSNVSSVDNFLTRPAILGLLGMSLKDFKTQDEAIAVLWSPKLHVRGLILLVLSYLLCLHADMHNVPCKKYNPRCNLLQACCFQGCGFGD